MTTPAFDLSAAKTKAGDEDSEKATLAAGRLSNAVDRLITKVMSSDDHDDLQKEAVLSAASSNVLMLFGASGQQPRAVDSTQPPTDPQPTRSRRSGDEDNDLADQLNRANAAKAAADAAKKTAEQELQKMLTAVGQALGGISIPIGNDGKVTSDIKGMITTGLNEAEQQGKTSAIGDGNVPKADVKAQADAALAKVKAVKESPMKGGKTSKAEAEQAIQAVIDLVS